MGVLMNPSHEAIVLAIQDVLPQARAAWLFGSAANGTLRDDSDMDIAVTLPKKLTTHEYIAATLQLEKTLGREIDLLDFTRLATIMQYQIITTGILLFTHEPVQTWKYNAFVQNEYQNIQKWRVPMIRQLTQRLMPV